MQALALPAHAELECRAAISGRIEKLVLSLVLDMVSGVVDGGLDMVQRSAANLIENEHSDALLLGTNVTRRRLGGRSAGPLSRVIAVLSVCHELLLKNKTMSQRELYYLLIKHFQSQRELNVALQDACATLGVPRYALNIGAATRGVLAGTIQIGPAASAGLVDGAMVGSAGWPIPGDLKAVYETCFQSDANYILVIEKLGIFQRLYEDSFFDHIPCILLCGRGYPSVATRIMLARLAEQLGIPVVGLADYNPHGLALLQTYRRGGIQTSLEAGDVSTEVKWLGLRASHIEDMPWVGQGEALTDRDEAVVANLRAQVYISSDPRYMAEVEAMKGCGKHELQCLYGHPSGTKYLSNEFLPTALLQHDYI